MEETFERWTKNNDVGSPPAPLESLLLGFLRYVGRGFTLGDLEECTAIDGETHRQFVLSFIKYDSSDLWDKFVIKTKQNEDAKYNYCIFMSAGFPGCINSVNGTHLIVKICAD